jgi:hypothetical protein
VVPGDHLLYVDFAGPGAAGTAAADRPYDEAPPMDALKGCVDRFLEDHNAESKKPMPLVMFPDAVEVGDERDQICLQQKAAHAFSSGWHSPYMGVN